MNYSEVKELLSAGFTAEEIRGMLNPQNTQAFPQIEKPNVSEQPTAEHSENSENFAQKDPDPGADQAGAPAENPNIPKNDEQLNQLNNSIQKLIKTIQVSNLHNNSIPTNGTTDINDKVDSIMASIIRPEHNTKGD